MTGKRYTFLYVPEDSGSSRRLSIPRLLLWLAGAGSLVVLVLAGLYVVGLFMGTSWLPGGSRLQRENRRLAGELQRLGERVAVLRDDLQDAFRYQRRMAVALGVTPLTPAEAAAGIGGRHARPRISFPRHWDTRAVRDGTVDRTLDDLVRQAHLQEQAYRSLLDTLGARADLRRHLPSIRPVDGGWLSSGFGLRRDPFTGRSRFHRGIDFSVHTGTPVRATADGVVIRVRRERGLGKMVRIDHGNGITTTYAHLSRWLVHKGDRVRRGQVIAESGNTGRSTAPHLHYEVRVGGRSVNPLPYVLDRFASY